MSADRLSEEQLVALERTAKAATPDPWNYDHDDCHMITGGTNLGLVATVGNPCYPSRLDPANASHVCSFDPKNALTLLSDLRSARAERDAARLDAATAWAKLDLVNVELGAVVASLRDRLERAREALAACRKPGPSLGEPGGVAAAEAAGLALRDLRAALEAP